MAEVLEFKKGESSPSYRAIEMCRKVAPECIETLVKIMRDGKDATCQIEAARTLLYYATLEWEND